MLSLSEIDSKKKTEKTVLFKIENPKELNLLQKKNFTLRNKEKICKKNKKQ